MIAVDVGALVSGIAGLVAGGCFGFEFGRRAATCRREHVGDVTDGYVAPLWREPEPSRPDPVEWER